MNYIVEGALLCVFSATVFTVNSICFVDFSSKKGGGIGGMFGMLKGLVGSKSLTRADMESVLDKMRDHLIGMISHLAPTHPVDLVQHYKVHPQN